MACICYGDLWEIVCGLEHEGHYFYFEGALFDKGS